MDTEMMGWVREGETERPCRRCQQPTTRLSGYTDEGDCESGPFVVERPLCAPCDEAETAEAEAMAEAYAAWERSHFNSDAEYEAYLRDMERQYAEIGDES